MHRFLRLLFVLLLAGSAVHAGAQGAFPAKTVKIILPYAAGGGADQLTRAVGQALSETWKQPVVIENRPGAGAVIGTEAVAKAPADGYTLLVTAATMAVSPIAYPKLPYDVLKDFAPISLLAESPYVLAVNPAVPAKSVSELLKVAHDAPKKLNFGSPGNGTLSHLAYELLRSRTGLDATVIAYKGSNPALLDALGGQVDFILDTPAAVAQHVKNHKLRALAVSTTKRSASLPDVPTLAEAGVPGYDVTVWFGLMAPAGTPAEVVQKIHADVVKVLSTPALSERLAKSGLEVTTSTPAEFSSLLRADVGKWTQVVKQASIKFE